MLTNFTDYHDDPCCRKCNENKNNCTCNDKHKEKENGSCEHGHKHHHKLRTEFQLIWDCLCCYIPKPIKNSCLIPRGRILFTHTSKKS